RIDGPTGMSELAIGGPAAMRMTPPPSAPGGTITEAPAAAGSIATMNPPVGPIGPDPADALPPPGETGWGASCATVGSAETDPVAATDGGVWPPPRWPPQPAAATSRTTAAIGWRPGRLSGHD